MRIVTLIENTLGSHLCAYEHGLSIYIETEHHRILMDTGATAASIHNAQQLGIDLAQVDTVILSHGHYDHTGGVMAFSALNPAATIYLQRSGGGAFYHGDKYIGIDPTILSLPQLNLIDGDLRIDDELSLFTNITGRRHWPESNTALSCREADGSAHQDSFDHEQCLVINFAGKHVLLSGCAHNGILNIMDRYRELYHHEPDLVISGFHMKKNTAYTVAEIQTIQAIAMELKQTKTIYYSGHCTSEPAFMLMRAIMGEQLQALHSGDEIRID